MRRREVKESGQKANSVRKERYVISLLLTTLVFFVGVYIGSEMTRAVVDDSQTRSQKDVLNSESLSLELSLLSGIDNKTICDYTENRLSDIIESKAELGRKIETGDFPQDKKDLLESQFTISLARFYIFLESQEKLCGIDKPKILFFKSESEESREQGRILDYLVYNIGDKNIIVMTFFEDLIERQPLLGLFYEKYNVTKTPTIIIKDKKFEGVQSKNTVKDILCDYYNLTIC